MTATVMEARAWLRLSKNKSHEARLALVESDPWRLPDSLMLVALTSGGRRTHGGSFATGLPS